MTWDRIGWHWNQLGRRNPFGAIITRDNDPELIRVRQEIGYRQSPQLSFLSRTNPINKLFSRYAVRLKRRGKIIAITMASLLYAGIVAAIFKLIVK